MVLLRTESEGGSSSGGSSASTLSIALSDISRNSSSDSLSSSSSSDSSSPASDHQGVCSYRCLRNFVQETRAEDQSAQSSVFCLALHEGLLCGGRGDNLISMWRNSDASELAKLKSSSTSQGGGAVKALVMSGDMLYSAHQDNRVRVWRVSTVNHGQTCHLATLPTFKDQVLTASWSLLMKRRKRKKHHHHRVHHTDVVTSLALGDKVLYSASRDKTIKVWRLHDFRCIESFAAHDAAVNGLAAVPHLGLLFTCSADSTVRVWQRSQTSSKRLTRHQKVASLVNPSCVNVIALGGVDGEVLYAGGGDSKISVWERSGKRVEVYEKSSVLGGHSQAVLCMATMDELMCSGSADKSIRLWRRGSDTSYTCLCVVRGHHGPVKSLVLTVDRFGFCNIHSASLDARAKLWRVDYRPRVRDDDGEEERKMSWERYYFTCGDGGSEQGGPGRLNSIKCALDEDARHFHLVFQALQSS